jgi:uncharacterized protein (TIGR02677 family)
MMGDLPSTAAGLFNHVSADKASLYRAILEVFAAAKRQFQLQLRPEEVTAAARWAGDPPPIHVLQYALDQLVEWGNLQAQPDMSRVATLEDYYRKRLMYRLTHGGVAAEAGLQTFVETLAKRGELQSVALEDILTELVALTELTREAPLDVVKVHGALRALIQRFEELADRAEAFMAGLARTIELQRAEVNAVLGFKARLIDYLQRFIGDLVTRSGQIAEQLRVLTPLEPRLLRIAAERDARDSAPEGGVAFSEATTARLAAWQERWHGLRHWFISDGGKRPQAELLRASALSAIPQLLQAVSLLHERRIGRSDRAADFRHLALWFAEAGTEADAHRLWRAAFALSPVRHLALAIEDEQVGASTRWQDAPTAPIHPKLRERGELPTRGGPPKIIDRSKERAMLAARVAEEAAQTEAARQRLATNRETRLSELGRLDSRAFRLFLTLLGEALASQTDPEKPVERVTSDGSLLIRLMPLEPHSRATVETELGEFVGRDHSVLIRPL